MLATIFTSQLTSMVAQKVKNLPAMRETQVQSLGWEDPLEEEMATHSWTEKPGRLQLMGSQRLDSAERPSLQILHNYIVFSS